MVNGPLAPSRPLTAQQTFKSEALDLSTVDTKYCGPSEPRSRLFGLPEAPCYRPTAEEFADPLKYIEKIAPYGKKFGVIKIVPPDEWKPTFAVDTERFHFRTRKQELNSMEAKCRANLNYIDQLFKFHTQHGTPIGRLPVLDKQPIDLYRLREIVEELGGFRLVNSTTRLWQEVSREMGFPEDGAYGLSVCTSFKTAYQRYILPYETFLSREKPKIQSSSPSQSPVKSSKSNGSSPGAENTPFALKIPNIVEPSTNENGNAQSETVITNGTKQSNGGQNGQNGQSSSNFQQGLDRREHEMETRVRKRVKRESDTSKTTSTSPIKKVASPTAKPHPGENCEACGRGDDGIHMLLCDGCESGYHIYCLDPPLREVPKVDWYCSRCLVGTGEFGFEEGGTYSLAEFQKKANDFKSNYFKSQDTKVVGKEIKAVTDDDVEKEFWRLVQTVHETVEVEYGADIHSSTHGSGFPTLEKHPRDPYSADPWNLNIMPLAEDSLLRYIKTDISGMTVPWLYVGMCFSTFCWHNEDHYTYSINYQHFGETKTWYGIPGSDAVNFEEVMRKAVPELFEQQPDLLMQLVTIFSPERLVKQGVTVYACDQHANEFVITFPQAYHAGFNHGFNFNEAVNFSVPDWVSDGHSKASVDRYKMFGRQPVFSHDELLLTAAAHDNTIKTAIWLSEALKEMVQRELHQRDTVRKANTGLEEKSEEVDLPEEQYQCGVCKVFSYLSQITCRCTTKVTCLEHFEELCDCPSNSRILRARFSDDYLVKLERKVAERAHMPVAWRERFFLALKEGPRPSIRVLRSLLTEGERIPYPIEELAALKIFVTKANDWIEEANGLIAKKPQGRRKSDKLRKGQKTADIEERERLRTQQQRQPEYVHKLLADAERLAFDSQEIHALKEKSESIDAWKRDAKSLMAMPSISIEQCSEIIESGKALNIDFPEINQFETYVKQLRWLERARPSFNAPLTLYEVREMWTDGANCGVPPEALEMHRLNLRKEAGETWEGQVQQLLALDKVPIESLMIAAAQAINLSVTPETQARVESIIGKVREVHEAVQIMIRRALDPDYTRRPNFNDLKDLNDRLELLPSRPQEADRLPPLQQKLNEWIRKGKRLFGKANAPLDILGQHLDHVEKRNAACLSLDDFPRDPVEPSSRENSPMQLEDSPKADLFCMCRQPEAGLMLECDVCHEWYHGKCLKVSRKKVKEDDRYVCPVCDWRVEIPRPSNRPKLEDLQALEQEALNLPFQPMELSKLRSITATGQKFRERLRPFLAAYLVLTSAELSTLKFYLRKLEGSEVLLQAETNFFRAKIHEFYPIAPEAPPVIGESRSTRKPRLTKKQKELVAQGLDPYSIPGGRMTNSLTPKPSTPKEEEQQHPILSGIPQTQPVFTHTTPYAHVAGNHPTFTSPAFQTLASQYASTPGFASAASFLTNQSFGAPSFNINAVTINSVDSSVDLFGSHKADSHLFDSGDKNSNLFAQLASQGLSAELINGALKGGLKAESGHHTDEDHSMAYALADFSTIGNGDDNQDDETDHDTMNEYVNAS